MKESILSKIKDIALKLAESNDTLTSADLANELKDFGIDGSAELINQLRNLLGFDQVVMR